MMSCRRTTLTAAVAAAGMLTAPVAMAHHAPKSCSGSGWTITIVAGPCAVNDTATPSCADPGPNTGIQYQITGSAADVIATLVTANNTVSTQTGNVVYDACKGEPITGLGKYACQDLAVKLNPDGSRKFWVVVGGHKGVVDTSIVVKNYKTTKAFAIQGLGSDVSEACVSSCGNFDPDQTLTKTEILKFKDCSVAFDYDVTTGEVTNAQLTADSDPSCEFHTAGVEDLEINLSGVGSLGTGKFGDGIIASGSASCTTRVIAGRVYTWGKPCP